MKMRLSMGRATFFQPPLKGEIVLIPIIQNYEWKVKSNYRLALSGWVTA